MKILLAPDSFKGSLSSQKAISLLKDAARNVFEDCEFVSVPMADGGEGTMEVLVNVRGGSFGQHSVTGPSGHPVNARYGVLDSSTAMIEMAEASGITLVSGEERNPLYTSSYGTGELIAHLLSEGFTNIIMAIGGSATNDGGIGAASALGIDFLGQNGKSVKPIGKNLGKIESICTDNRHLELDKAHFTIMCDVTNPLTGPNGATFVYGPQKGGSKEELQELEKGMCHYAEVLRHTVGKDYSSQEGAGAAGGISIPFLAFTDARLQSGIDTVLDTIQFEKLLEGVDLVVTGEGRVDWQSAYGKVLSGIGHVCKKKRIPVVAIAGGMGEGFSDIYDHGICAIMPLVNRPMELSDAMTDSETLFYDAAWRMFRLIQIGMKISKNSDL